MGIVYLHVIYLDDDVPPFRFLGVDAVVRPFYVPGHYFRSDVNHRVPARPFRVDVDDLYVGFVVGEVSLHATELECAIFLADGSHRSYPVGEGELQAMVRWFPGDRVQGARVRGASDGRLPLFLLLCFAYSFSLAWPVSCVVARVCFAHFVAVRCSFGRWFFLLWLFFGC